MRKWEYLVADDTASNWRQPSMELNAFGADGWELVSVRTAPQDTVEYIFKREIVE